ncbi:inositol monophosphatase family protein [Nigerium massiliense]|uniref:inositol monophosphatase family protein n=1 Tax=Nigerium massiliense TaxID=1522317 RepID=UPI0006932C04|nr:inositol monophosphatase [Nigerium massiliense]
MKTQTVTDAIQEVAAREILPRFRTLHGDEIVEKHPGDLVTVADRRAEVELTAILRDYHPDALVVGEESVFDDPGILEGLPEAEHAWVIDPVDGTNNFARGSADFGVMVVECAHGLPVRSWIWQPVHERMFVAERGNGVTLNGRPLRPMGGPQRPLRAAAGPRSLQHHSERLTVRPTVGSCAIDYPDVLTGKIDAVVYRSQNPWDHLPASLMIRELGGRAALNTGEDYRAGVASPLLISACTPDAWDIVNDTLVTPDWLATHPTLNQ